MLPQSRCQSSLRLLLYQWLTLLLPRKRKPRISHQHNFWSENTHTLKPVMASATHRQIVPKWTDNWAPKQTQWWKDASIIQHYQTSQDWSKTHPCPWHKSTFTFSTNASSAGSPTWKVVTWKQEPEATTLAICGGQIRTHTDADADQYWQIWQAHRLNLQACWVGKQHYNLSCMFIF